MMISVGKGCKTSRGLCGHRCGTEKTRIRCRRSSRTGPPSGAGTRTLGPSRTPAERTSVPAVAGRGCSAPSDPRKTASGYAACFTSISVPAGWGSASSPRSSRSRARNSTCSTERSPVPTRPASTGLSPARRNELLRDHPERHYFIQKPAGSDSDRQVVRYDRFFPFEQGEVAEIVRSIARESSGKEAGVVVTASILDAASYGPVVEALNALSRMKEEGDDRSAGSTWSPARTPLTAHEVFEDERLRRPDRPEAREHVTLRPRPGGPAVRRPGGGRLHAAPDRPGRRGGLRVAEAGALAPRPSRSSSSAGGAGSSSAGTSTSRSRSRAGC